MYHQSSEKDQAPTGTKDLSNHSGYIKCSSPGCTSYLRPNPRDAGSYMRGKPVCVYCIDTDPLADMQPY